MTMNRKTASYNFGRRYNSQMADILPDISVDRPKLTNFFTRSKDNSKEKSSSSSKRVQQLSKLALCIDQANHVLAKWHQVHDMKKKIADSFEISKRGARGEEKKQISNPTTLDFDRIMEEDLEYQLKQLELEEKLTSNVCSYNGCSTKFSNLYYICL